MSANVYQPAFDETEGGTSRARLGRQAGAGALGLGLYELAPDTSYWPSHYHWANEEMLIVLSGTPSLRTAEGARRLAPGDVVSFRRGPEGTHQLANYDDGVARFLILSEMNGPEIAVYPDSNKVGVMSRPPGSPGDEDAFVARFRLDDEVDYWEGERREGADG